MKISILGSCSGTEPFLNRHHTAFALELGDRIYWFDAGEACSHTAHTMGLDLLRVSDIFISHAHMDHVGGLANLLWTIRKLSKVKKEQPRHGDIRVYMPNMKTWDGVLTILQQSEGNYENNYQTLALPVEEGVLSESPEIRVMARGNLHLKPIENMPQSFSFLIEAEGKRIIYSGDVKDLCELLPWLKEGCDLLLMETGHHHPTEVCKRILDEGLAVGSLRFLHHGRDILYDYNGQLKQCKEILPQAAFCNDRDVFAL